METNEIEVLEEAQVDVDEHAVFVGVDEIVAIARKGGLSFKQIARICGVSINSVFRWNKKNAEGGSKAKSDKIKPLILFLLSPSDQLDEPDTGTSDHLREKKLSEASLEDLRDRANQLGFKVTFTEL